MQDMGKEEEQHLQRHHSTETELVSGGERVAYSGPLSGPINKRGARKSARFNIPAEQSTSSQQDEQYLEVTLDVSDDFVALQSVKSANGAEENPELTLLTRGFKKKSGSSIVRTASAKIRQEFRWIASFSKRPSPPRFDRTKSAATHALKGLKFISKTEGGSGWAAVEKRFDEITAV